MDRVRGACSLPEKRSAAGGSNLQRDLFRRVVRLEFLTAHHPRRSIPDPPIVHSAPQLLGIHLLGPEGYRSWRNMNALRAPPEGAVRHLTRVAAGAGVCSQLEHALLAYVITDPKPGSMPSFEIVEVANGMSSAVSARAGNNLVSDPKTSLPASIQSSLVWSLEASKMISGSFCFSASM